jgi:hypothetical protein
MVSSVGKRQRERQKIEKAQVKAERRAARQAANLERTDVPSQRSEAELIEDLGNLQRGFETGEVSEEDFAARREQIQVQLERLLR